MRLKLRVVLALAVLLLTSARPVISADRCDELWAAVTSDDVKRVADLINAGVAINCQDVMTGETALMAAATNGHLDLVKFLLMLGADPAIKTPRGHTALDLVRSSEAAMSKIPAMAEKAQRQRQVIALLQQRAGGPQQSVTPAQVVPTNMNEIARMKLDAAKSALMSGLYDPAGKTILEVMRMSGVSDRWRARAFTLGCELGMRQKDWELAKTMCEKVLTFTAADDDDRAWSTDTLKTLRKLHPELFKK